MKRTILTLLAFGFVLSGCGADGAPEPKRDTGISVGGDAYIGVTG